MSQSNAEKKEIYRQLSESKIGKRFWDMKLSDMGEQGVDITNRAKSGELRTYLAAGGGFTFYGTNSYDFSVLVAKAAALQDFTVTVVSLAHLTRALDDWEYAEQLAGNDVLLVTRFCDVGANPMSSYQRFQLEDLLNDRVDAKKAIFVQSDQRLVMYKDWWNPRIIQTLTELNNEMEIKKHDGHKRTR